MTYLWAPKTKRLPILAAAMLLGVGFAGFVSSVLASPVSENDYLHEHLSGFVNTAQMTWVGDSGNLSVPDRAILTSHLVDMDRPGWTARSKMPIVGQALAATKKSNCFEASKPCELSVRLGREFREDHTNLDFRVINVTEKSQRVTFGLAPDTSDLQLRDIVDETRLFRFYQTQTGWVQKTSELLQSDSLKFDDRTARFTDRFSNGFVGFNYYPASASWKSFWTEFPVAEIKHDLEIMGEMNANSLRIFINHAYFDVEDSEKDARAKLRLFLDLCAEKDIKVLVSLFDLRPDYTVANLERDRAHIDKVLASVAGHPAILGVDIKNQADLDFEDWGQGRVKGWLTVMARHIQLTYPDIAVTVGWSQPTAATQLVDVVDFVTYHEYGNPKGFDMRLAEIKARAGDKPVMITELGSTVWTPFRTRKSAEFKQALRLEKQLQNAVEADGVFVWTLHDFDHVGSEVVGWRPWRKAQQRHFGLLRADGSARPARDVFRAHARARLSPSVQHAQNAK